MANLNLNGDVSKVEQEYEMSNVLATYSKSLEELSYKVSALEDSMAELNAYITEIKEGGKDARS